MVRAGALAAALAAALAWAACTKRSIPGDCLWGPSQASVLRGERAQQQKGAFVVMTHLHQQVLAAHPKPLHLGGVNVVL